MKNPLLVVITSAISVSFASITHADSIREIFDGIENEKAAKLAAYLQANPQADDRLDGVSHLGAAYVNLGEPEKAGPLLVEKYELLIKGKIIQDFSPHEIYETVKPMILSLNAVGKRDEAKTLLAKVRKDMATHRMAKIINQYMDLIARKLSGPGGSEVLEIAFIDLNGKRWILQR